MNDTPHLRLFRTSSKWGYHFMFVERIAKRTLSLKSFRVSNVEEVVDGLEIMIVPNRRSLPVCSCCGRKRPIRDTLHPCRWRHVKLWGIETFIVYSPRRVKCPTCGIRVERIPWSMGKSRLSLPPNFVFRFAKCAAKRKDVVFAPPTRAHTTKTLLLKSKKRCILII